LSSTKLKDLLGCIRRDERVIIPPMVGYDAGVHRFGDILMVVSTDPCMGVPEEWFGWLMVHYAASDVALFGSKPEFCTINLLGSGTTKASQFRKAMKQACNATKELNMAIVGGHTGTYNSLRGMIGVCTAYGMINSDNVKTPAKARPGDSILCTKSIGLETLVNFSLMQKELARKLFGKKISKALSERVKTQSCVKEALLMAEFLGVRAMHDATEEGVVTALNELANASDLGFEVKNEQLPITSEMRKLQEHFNLSERQILSTSSTGTVLASIDPQIKNEIIEKLKAEGIEATIIGNFTKQKKRVLIKKGKSLAFPKTADDPYELVMSGTVEKLQPIS